AARERLDGVRLPDERLEQIAAVCAGFEVDGLRADLVTANAALAHAAWRGRAEVTAEGVRAAARPALPHRRRRDPRRRPGLDESLLDELLNSTSPDDGPDDTPPGGAPPEGGDGPSPPSGDGAEHSDAPDAARPGDAPSGDGEATESEAPGGAGEAEAGKVAA